MNKTSRVFVAGHRGLVGSAICRRLTKAGFTNVITRSREALDLRNQQAVKRFFDEERPEYVFIAATKVGGILANNTFPAEFIYDNLALQTNLIHESWDHGAKKLLFLASSCVYPKFAPQPIREEHLLTGALEPTNEWYAIAKIAGIKLAEAYRKQYEFNAISVMPTNLYGPGDNFDLKNSHVLPALMRKFVEAKESCRPEVVVWGTGTPRREFLHVDDLADAVVFLMSHYDDAGIVNISTGTDVTISELASLLKLVTGYEGEISFDRTKPDGTPQKLLDISKLRSLGWQAAMSLDEGVAGTYRWYLEHRGTAIK